MAVRRKLTGAAWAKSWQRGVAAITARVVKQALRTSSKKPAKKAVARKAVAKKTVAKKAVVRRPTHTVKPLDGGAGSWLPGVAVGPGGMRAYRLYRPPGLLPGERRPLLVMLHGCGQAAAGFAASTRMNRIADRERFWVLYPEQDRLANPQGCWQWFEANSGRAAAEMSLLMRALAQVCLAYPIDAEKTALAGLSAGASMAALLAATHPARFRAVVMHSGLAPGLAKSRATALAAMQGRRRAPPLPASDLLPPLLVIQGAADPLVAASNGGQAARLWAEALGAVATAPRLLQRGKRYPMTQTDFKRGGRVLVSQVEIARLGHAWSGGVATAPFGDPQGPDASRMVWAFAARQFRLGAVRQRTDLAGRPA